MLLVVVAVALIFLAALFSGLNLGLMSLDTFELKRKADLGDANAAKVYAIRSKGNLLLVTLLTGNVAVISTLSLVLNSALHGLVAGVLTTVLVTIFGEIIPQAILVRYALHIGASLAGVVRVIMIIFYPVCAPIAYILDRVLGDELPTIYTKSELTRIIEEHRNVAGSNIDGDEARIASGALNFGDRKISQIMTPRSVAKMVPASLRLDETTIRKLKSSGFSRIPVFRGEATDDIGGILYVKDLIGIKAGKRTVGDLARPKVFFVNLDDNLDDTLNAFLKTRSHLFIVVNEFAEVQGIVTIEDVLEEIIDREIADEFDRYDDMRKVARRAKRLAPAIKR
ncbi:MAG TPA: CNNM domain-containing protein [Candidatus Saccharimonadales bacterium]|nr:CNNM domain-containing protein [Candidatus Saccharimonadales bacterium]